MASTGPSMSKAVLEQERYESFSKKPPSVSLPFFLDSCLLGFTARFATQKPHPGSASLVGVLGRSVEHGVSGESADRLPETCCSKALLLGLKLKAVLPAQVRILMFVVS